MSVSVDILNEDSPYLLSIYRRYGEVTGKPIFSFKVANVITSLEPLIKALDAARKPTERELELEKAKEELLKEYAMKDKAGKPVTKVHTLQDGNQVAQYQLGENEAVYNSVFISLINAEFNDVEEITKKRLQEYNSLLTSKTTLNVEVIKMSEVPENIITGNDMVLLLKYGLLVWDTDK